MTVQFLSQIVPYPPHGGVLQRGFNLVRELGRRARVHLLAFVHPDALPSEGTLDESRRVLGSFCDSVEYFTLWPKQSRLHSTTALAAGLISSQPFSFVAHRSQAFAHAARKGRRATHFDVVHADTLALSQFVDLGPERPSATVLTHHNIESQLMSRRSLAESGTLARWFVGREAAKLRAYEHLVCPAFDINVCVSRQDLTELDQRVPGLRGALVPNGVDINYFTPDSAPAEPILIYTGGMNMFANRDAVTWFLREAWPPIAAEMPTTQFFVVGQTPSPEILAFAAADPRIRVTGYVDDIRPLVRRAAVYVVPIRIGGGTRLKVLDAMASGKAIVSTAIGCEGIDVVDGEHLLIADDPIAFAAATLALLREPARRRSLGHAARARAEERYSWPAIGDQLVAAYGLAIEHHLATGQRRGRAAS